MDDAVVLIILHRLEARHAVVELVEVGRHDGDFFGSLGVLESELDPMLVARLEVRAHAALLVLALLARLLPLLLRHLDDHRVDALVIVQVEDGRRLRVATRRRGHAAVGARVDDLLLGRRVHAHDDRVVAQHALHRRRAAGKLAWRDQREARALAARVREPRADKQHRTLHAGLGRRAALFGRLGEVVQVDLPLELELDSAWPLPEVVHQPVVDARQPAVLEEDALLERQPLLRGDLDFAERQAVARDQVVLVLLGQRRHVALGHLEARLVAVEEELHARAALERRRLYVPRLLLVQQPGGALLVAQLELAHHLLGEDVVDLGRPELLIRLALSRARDGSLS